MEGVEILAMGTWSSEFEPNATVLLFVLALSLLGGLAIGLREKVVGLGLAIGLVVGLFVGLVSSCVVGLSTVKTYTTYKVTVSDTVSMSEFMDRYEILNREGKIYTVMERNTNENP